MFTSLFWTVFVTFSFRWRIENVLFGVSPKQLSFRLSFSLSDMTNYKSAFGKVCRIKNRHTFKSMPILNSAYFTECRRHIVIPCGKVCRIKNRHTFKSMPILNSAYFKSMPILNSSYHAVKYAELRIGILLKVCRFVIRHITQTETQTETEANFTHCLEIFQSWKPYVRTNPFTNVLKNSCLSVFLPFTWLLLRATKCLAWHSKTSSCGALSECQYWFDS